MTIDAISITFCPNFTKSFSPWKSLKLLPHNGHQYILPSLRRKRIESISIFWGRVPLSLGWCIARIQIYLHWNRLVVTFCRFLRSIVILLYIMLSDCFRPVLYPSVTPTHGFVYLSPLNTPSLLYGPYLLRSSAFFLFVQWRAKMNT